MKVRIYTDGACSGNPGKGGWASVFITEDNIDTQSGSQLVTTNNQMELKAVVVSLERITDKFSPSDEYEIYSDSAYVVNSINNNWIEKWRLNNWKTSRGDTIKNEELWKECLSLLSMLRKQNYKIKFIKIKGHSGDTFNDYADNIARKQIQSI